MKRLNVPDFSHDYLAGESLLAISKKLGISRPTVKQRLIQAGIAIRDGSAAQSIRSARMTPDERRRNAAHAHAAVRGIAQTEEHRCKIALTRELRQCGITRSERLLAAALRSRGISISPQKAIGRYNIDVAIDKCCIAVEIFGGNWHASGRHAGRFRKRCDYILDRGWLPVIIWVTKDYPLESSVVDYIVTLTERCCRGESLGRQEQVIRGDGHSTPVKHNPHNGAVIRTHESFYGPRGEYGRFPKQTIRV